MATMNFSYYVYILTNDKHSTLYTGVTNDLKRRMYEHRTGTNRDKFVVRYRTTMLMYYEIFDDSNAAIAREKQIKSGSRQKKVDLITHFNPTWRDLYPEIVTF